MLIIFTSPSHTEISNYWHWISGNQIIVGSNLLLIIDSKGYHGKRGWNSDAINKLLNHEEENLVLIHESELNKVQKLQNELAITRVFGYTTVGGGLVGKLWSWDNYYHEFQIPNKEPELPFDKLCWAIHLNHGEFRDKMIDKAKNSVIDFFQKKESTENKHDKILKLNLLCETPEGALKALSQKLTESFDDYIEEIVNKIAENKTHNPDHLLKLRIELKNCLIKEYEEK
jgi:hypothetical protein